MERNFSDILELKFDTELAKTGFKELSASVKKLYKTFTIYKLKPHLDRRTHCVSEEDERTIHSKPLTQLLPEELEKYGRKAMTTWGDQDDFRYFLPRLFEFYPFIGTGLLDPEIVFSKLTYADWEKWPQAERDAVVDYFHALWKFVLHAIEPTPWTYSENFLCSIAQAIDDITPFLTYWQNSDEPVALRNLSAFIYQNCDQLRGIDSRRMAFWEQRIEQWKQVVDWLKNRNTLEFFANKMTRESHLIEELSEILALAQQCTDNKLA